MFTTLPLERLFRVMVEFSNIATELQKNAGISVILLLKYNLGYVK